MKTEHARVLAANVLFSSLFPLGWCFLMLPEALVQTSMFEREWQGPCVSQEVCHSATTVSVVWLLALDFIFTRCVSPCPRISMLDVVQTGGLLDRSRTGALQLHTLSRRDHMMMVQVALKVDNVLPGRVPPTFSKVAEVAEPKREGSAMRCQGVVQRPTPSPP